jgi:DNA replication and repair protein RecF
MFVQKLILNNFKNNSNSEILISKKISIFVGNNGTGKTNILESIYYFSVLKSYLNISDKDLIKYGEEFFFISCLYLSKNEDNLIECGFKAGDKKNIKFNKKKYDKISEHIGKFPVIFFSPYDTDLIREGSEFRRKFFDLVISFQSDNYLKSLIEYNHFLEQRNHYLKLIGEKRTHDYSLIENLQS